MEDLNTDRPGHSTGPRTPEGKAASSQNSLQHGCRSKAKLLPGEDPDHFEALHDRWIDEFRPGNEADFHFVEQVILNDWFLQRALRRYTAVEEELAATDFLKWTDAQHKKMQLALRYKGEAERALGRALRAAETWRRNQFQDYRQAVLDRHRAERELAIDQARALKQKAQLDKKYAEAACILRETQKNKGIDMSKDLAELERDRAQAEIRWEKLFPTTPEPSPEPLPKPDR